MSQIDVNEKRQLVNMVSHAERQRRSRKFGVFSDVEGADAGNVGRCSYARRSPQRSKIQPKEFAGSSPATMYVVFILRESYS